MKINLKIFANPYYLFAIVWAVGISLYSLGWSRIYPALTGTLFLFVTVAVILNVCMGTLLHNVIKTSKPLVKRTFNVKMLTMLNVFLWALNFLYSGIPLINVVRGQGFDHAEGFGIPSLIVVVISFTGFLCLLCFHHYSVTKEKKYLLYYLINISFFVLVFSRGNMMMTIMSTFFLWLFCQQRKISVSRIVAILCSALLVLYLFGVTGNYRVIKELQGTNTSESGYNSNLIIAIADPPDSFRENLVPDEFMWSYIYLTSPIGNLQYNIEKAQVDVTLENAIAFGVNEYTWDFVAKRLVTVFNVNKLYLYMFSPALSVPTTFADSYLYLGWYGIGIYLFSMLLLPIAYYSMVKRCPLGEIGMAVLCCIYFFSIFDNMFIVSGLSLQLVYPFLFLKIGSLAVPAVKGSNGAEPMPIKIS